MTATSPGSTTSEKMPPNLARLRTLLIDLDGVVYRGNTPIPGAEDFFDFLRAQGYDFGVLTNNATATAAQVARRLAKMGIDVSESAIFTSGDAVARYLKKREPKGARVYIVGEAGLLEPVLQAGFELDETSPDYVLVGLDRKFDYEKMAKACLAIRRGAELVASNPDTTFPSERGLLPGAGALLASIVACTEARPTIVGKPNKEMLLLAMERLGATREQTAIIGDRVDTDVQAGRRAGIATILVLTGVTSQEDLDRSRLRPDYVFRDLRELRARLEAAGRASLSAHPRKTTAEG